MQQRIKAVLEGEKGGQPGTSSVYLIKRLMSVHGKKKKKHIQSDFHPNDALKTKLKFRVFFPFFTLCQRNSEFVLTLLTTLHLQSAALLTSANDNVLYIV